MAAANFERALALVLVHEGGWANHPKDPGGATMKGVTLATYRATLKPKATKEDLRRISNDEIAIIYRRHYWDPIKGDDLPSGVDYAVFDFAVNSGVGRASKYLQTVLGVSVDGVIGPATIKAAQSASARQIIDKLCARRLAFLRNLSTFKTFGKGWERRVSDVVRIASEMAGTPPDSVSKKRQGNHPETLAEQGKQGRDSTSENHPSLWSRIRSWFGQTAKG